jgi:putative tryptophan/tyrosine transport system substrate-binding protein
VESGLVASLSRPPANATGVGFQLAEITAKRLEMLHRLVPTAETIAFLTGGNGPYPRGEARDLQSAARILGVRLLSLNARTESEIEAAFATVVERHVRALLISSGAPFIGAPTPIISLAARHAIPTLFAYKDSVTAGGLSSYGPDLAEGHHQAGLYAGRILRGEKPADLPVVQPTKFELVINLKTAKALGLTIPETLLATADEVIQ